MSARNELIDLIKKMPEDDANRAVIKAILDGAQLPYVKGSKRPAMRKMRKPRYLPNGNVNPESIIEERDICIDYGQQWWNYYGHRWPAYISQMKTIHEQAKDFGIDLEKLAPQSLSLDDINSKDVFFEAHDTELDMLATRLIESNEVGMRSLDYVKKKRWAQILRRSAMVQRLCRAEIPPKYRKMADTRIHEVWKHTHAVRYMLYTMRSTLGSMDGKLTFMQAPYHLVQMLMVMSICREHCHSHNVPGVLIQIPPGHAKTTGALADQALDMCKRPWRSCVIVHNVEKMAEHRHTVVAEHFNDETPVGRRRRALFPEISQHKSSSMYRLFLSKNGEKACPRQEGNLSPSGVHARMQGFSADDILFDDPTDQKEGIEASTRERTNSALKETWLPRLRGKTSFFRYICTAWHPEDFAEQMKKLLVAGQLNIGFYGRICGGPDDDIPFMPLWEAAADTERLRREYYTKGPAAYECNPGDAPILMADFSQKLLKDVVVGDEVIGFTDGNTKAHSRLTSSTVVANGSRRSKVVELTMESGRVIRCTPDHRWLHAGEFRRKRRHSTKSFYRPPSIGMPLAFLYNSVEHGRLDPKLRDTALWFAGLFDGEGSVIRPRRDIGHLRVAQCPKHNPSIAARMREALTLLGFRYSESNAGLELVFGTSWEDRFRFLTSIPSTKAAEKIPRSLLMSHWVQGSDRITSIRSAGSETVYSLQTTTGNYICWGYASKNCQYRNNPSGESTRPIKRLHFYDGKMYRDYKKGTLANEHWKKFFDTARWDLCIDPSGKAGRFNDKAGMIYSAYGTLRRIVPGPGGNDLVLDEPKLVFCRYWSIRASQHDITKIVDEFRNTHKIDRILVESVGGFHATVEDLIRNYGFRQNQIISKRANAPGTKAQKLTQYALNLEIGDALFPGIQTVNEHGEPQLELDPQWGPVADQIFLAGTVKDDNLLDVVRIQLSEVSYEIACAKGLAGHVPDQERPGFGPERQRMHDWYQQKLKPPTKRTHKPRNFSFCGRKMQCLS